MKYSKAVGTGLGGVIGAILAYIFKDTMSPESIAELTAAAVVVVSTLGAYLAPANK